MPNKAVSVKAIFEAESTERKATIENVEIKGVVGEIFPTRTLKIKITIQNDKLNGTANPFSTLKTNLPKGLGLNMNDYTGTTFTVSVRGINEW